jgi:flagellar biosynthetic protein FlhB
VAEEQDKQQKTEEATPQRMREAREKGQVGMSTEAISASSLLAVGGSFLVMGGFLAEAVGGLLVSSLSRVGVNPTTPLESGEAAQLVSDAIGSIGTEFILFILPALCVAALVGYSQAGLQITPKSIGFDASKISPKKGLERLFSARSAVRAGMAFAKVLVVMGTIAVLGWLQLPKMSALSGADFGPTLQMVGSIIVRCVSGAMLAILTLGFIDLLFQRWQHTKEQRMTKQEVKEEMKNTEGDPHMKARIRQIQREVASRRMMDDVPTATVIVTNPTHYAVALKYERDIEGGDTPRVVAKGVDAVAKKIKEIGGEAGVTLFEDRPLARALHARAEIGDEIPADLFEAVAAVLAYVYRVERRVVGV